jgi:hypothetical protein
MPKLLPPILIEHEHGQAMFDPASPHPGCAKVNHQIRWISLDKTGFRVKFGADSPWGAPRDFHTPGKKLTTPPNDLPQYTGEYSCPPQRS